MHYRTVTGTFKDGIAVTLTRDIESDGFICPGKDKYFSKDRELFKKHLLRHNSPSIDDAPTIAL
jgi:hypothetical protein